MLINDYVDDSLMETQNTSKAAENLDMYSNGLLTSKFKSRYTTKNSKRDQEKLENIKLFLDKNLQKSKYLRGTAQSEMN